MRRVFIFYWNVTVQILIFQRNLGHRKPHTSSSWLGFLDGWFELGIVDICTDTSMMSYHRGLPRRGHIESLFHMWSYLEKHNNWEILVNPAEPDFDMADFQHEYWVLSIYGDVKEYMPPIFLFAESGAGDISEPRGQGFTITVYFDCDIGGDCVTCRSRTGFDIFLIGSPTYWRSSEQ